MLLAIIFHSAFPLFTSQLIAAWFVSHQPSDPTLGNLTGTFQPSSFLAFSCIWHFCHSPFQNLPTLWLP